MSKRFLIIKKKKQTNKLKRPGFRSRKYSSILVELSERKPAPGLSSIHYLFINFASKLLPITFITMHHQVITNFSIAHSCKMSQLQTLLRLRICPLQTQTLIFAVLIDDTTSMPELTNGLVENIPCTNKTQKIVLLIMLIMFVYFLKITRFFNTSSRSWQPITWNGNDKILEAEGPRADIWGQGPRAKKSKYPLLGKTFCDSLLWRNQYQNVIQNILMLKLKFYSNKYEGNLSYSYYGHVTVIIQWSHVKPVITTSCIVLQRVGLVLKSYKCSKTEVHWVLLKVLRNAPAKIQRKKQR